MGGGASVLQVKDAVKGEEWSQVAEEKLQSIIQERVERGEGADLTSEDVEKLVLWLEQEGVASRDCLQRLRSQLKEHMCPDETGEDKLPIGEKELEAENNTNNQEELAEKETETSGTTTEKSGSAVKSKGNDRKGKAISVDSLPSTALRCVPLSFLLRFTDHYQVWHHSTRDVVKEVIVPLTKDRECVWSDLDPKVSLLNPTEIAPPQIFVSHAWTNSWALVVLGLKAYAEFNKVKPEKLTCWIDIFVINQHNYMQELAQLDMVIDVCGNFIQLIDSQNAIPLRRVWCFYEVMSRLKSKKKANKLTVTVASITAPESSGKKDKSNDKTVTRPELVLASKKRMDEVLNNVNMEKAEATYPQDVDKIFSRVRAEIQGGFQTVNAEVKQALVQSAVLNTLEIAAKLSDGGKKGKGNGGKKAKGGGFCKISDLYEGL